MDDAPSTPLVRINKALADAGVCSRRKADELILSGEVSVNGMPVREPGLRLNPSVDKVTLRGRPVKLRRESEPEEYVYLLLHKPVQVVSTVSDPQGRSTVLDLVPDAFRSKRLYPVGRLDYFSEGLLLLTNDGVLTNRLTHPRHHLPRTYEVTVRQTPTPAMLRLMRCGMTLREGEKLAPVEVEVSPGKPTVLRMILRQGVNRQIRRMCRDLGLIILTLRRVGFGPLRLDDLPRGKIRPLRPRELAALQKAVESYPS